MGQPHQPPGLSAGPGRQLGRAADPHEKSPSPTGNIYESVVILYKRANQIAAAEKKELTKKLEDFRNDRDTMEEVFENKEQIEISKYYERQPKPDLVAISEFENGELYYRRAQSANPIDINGEE